MVFNSLIYLFFLAATFIAYYLLPLKFRWIWLLIASIGYFLSFIPVYIFILLAIVLLNCFLGSWQSQRIDYKRNQSLIFICSPRWRVIKKGDIFDDLTELFSINGMEYWDFSNSGTFIDNHEYFADIEHLNDTGARQFSKMISEKIFQSGYEFGSALHY